MHILYKTMIDGQSLQCFDKNNRCSQVRYVCGVSLKLKNINNLAVVARYSSWHDLCSGSRWSVSQLGILLEMPMHVVFPPPTVEAVPFIPSMSVSGGWLAATKKWSGSPRDIIEALWMGDVILIETPRLLDRTVECNNKNGDFLEWFERS